MPRRPISVLGEDAVEEHDSFNIRTYWHLLRRHKAALALLTLVGALGGYWMARSQVPMYQASATLIIGPEQQNLISGSSYNYYYSFRYQETQHDILKSATIARIAAADLSEEQKALFTPKHEPGPVQRLYGQARSAIDDLLAPKDDTGAGPVVAAAESASTANDEVLRYAGMIQGGMRVTPGRDSETVSLSYTSHSPELAALVPNLVAEAYIEYGIESRAERSERAGQWLGRQLLELREKLTESENALREFQLREGVVDVESFRALATSRLGQLNESVNRAQQEFSELSKRYGPKHPSMIAAQRELGEARQRLDEESRRVVTTSANQLDLVKLENDVKSNREMYELFRNRFNEADVTLDTTLANASILDRAVVPGGPISPNVSQMTTIGAMFGGFFAIVLIYLRERLDTTIKTHDQLEDKTGLPVLGIVPLVTGEDKRASRRYMRHRSREARTSLLTERYYIQSPRSPFSEAINHIRTSILHSQVGHPPRIVLVTSALQGEGKTTISTNLALAFSQLGKTLLIDADLRKPRVAQVTGLGRSAGPGLVEMLVGRAKEEEAIVSDSIEPHLDILRCGTIPPNPLELLSSDQMRALLEKLTGRYKHIVLDSAPVLPVSDALVAGQIVDGVLLVVQANKTSHIAVRDAVRRLASVQTTMLGSVFSQIDQRRTHYYYGRSGYYKSNYYSYGNKAGT